MMKLHKSKMLITTSCIIAIVLTFIENGLDFHVAVLKELWESLVCLFLYQFAAIALLFLATSLYIGHFKRQRASGNRLKNIEKLFFIFQIVLVAMIVTTFINTFFGIVFFISNIVLLGTGIGTYYKTKNEFYLSLLLWCIALQFMFEVFSILSGYGLASGFIWSTGN